MKNKKQNVTNNAQLREYSLTSESMKMSSLIIPCKMNEEKYIPHCWKYGEGN